MLMWDAGAGTFEVTVSPRIPVMGFLEQAWEEEHPHHHVSLPYSLAVRWDLWRC